MGRLVPGAFGLLLLASIVWSAEVKLTPEEKLEKMQQKMKQMKQDIKDEYPSTDTNAYRKNFVQFDRLMNLPDFGDGDKDEQNAEKQAYMEALLVAKTCFRDWVDDVECHMHVYERMDAAADGKAAKDQVKVDYKEGYESEVRLKQQLASLKNISMSETGHYDKILVALQQNFNNMVNSYEKEVDEIAAVFSKHLNSTEFDEIIQSLNSKMSLNMHAGDAEMKHAVVKMAIADWVKAEKTKSEHAGYDHADKSKWEQMMNKIPNTLKYSTRGATPFVKEHLAKALDILGKQEWYEEKKRESQTKLQKVAETMRHAAMQKSDSLIAQVMHAMENGMSHADMEFNM